MSTLLERLFSLERVRLSDPNLALEWAMPVPAWGITLIVCAAALLAALAYRRLEGSRAARTALGVLRCLALLLLVAMIARPSLTRTDERVESDWIVALVDRSESMRFADLPGRTREDQLRAAVELLNPVLRDLSAKRNVLWMGFDSRAFELTNDGTPNLAEPEGRRTLLATALEQTLRRTAAKPVAGIVLLSDGRTSESIPRPLLRALQDRQIPIFAVPLGSPTPAGSIALRRVTAPGVAFAGDYIPVTVDLDALGPLETRRASSLELVDEATGEVLDRAPVPDLEPGQSAQITLSKRSEGESEYRWLVRTVLPPGTGSVTPPAPVRVRVVDRPLRVALFDGTPRWEYRYLKNLLLRERSIRSSALLLSAERRYLQEGSDPLASVPRTAEEWAPFDVVILGDLRSELFSAEQMTQIRDMVAQKGLGLLWIAGPTFTPRTWRETPLGDLLPFTAPPDASGERVFSENVLVSPAPAAGRLGVLRLENPGESAWPAALSDPRAGWSALRFAQRLEPSRLKPAAEVLAFATPVSSPTTSDESRPLVVTMRYGAGRIVYVATDEIWRWRFGRGETLPERFWLPLIRLLARESLSRSGEGALLDASPSQTRIDSPVQLTLRLLDQSLLSTRPSNITLRVRSTDPRRPDEQTINLGPSDASGGVFTGAWTFAEPGEYEIRAADPALAALALSTRVEVRDRDDETREPATDHALLTSLADATGGRTLSPDLFPRLPELLPNREVRTLAAAATESLWDKPFVWVVLILLVCLEWLGRRLLRLA